MTRALPYTFLLLVFIAVSPRLNAQDSILRVQRPVYVTGSFFYDFPESFGATAGIDLPLKNRLRIRVTQAGIEKRRYRDIFLSGELGFYRYRFNNTGVFMIGAIGKRIYKDDHPFYFEAFLNAVLLRTYYDGIVYEVDENNNINTKYNFGRYYAGAGIGLSTGWDMEKTKWKKPFTFQLRPSLWFQFPYNSFTLPHFSAQATFKYRLPNLNRYIKQYRTVKHAKAP